MNPNDTIQIGARAEYEQKYNPGNFAVYCKTLDQIISFVVAKFPGEVRGSDPAPIPTSAVREYNSESEAIAALNKWADAPRDVPLLKKPKEATDLCRNVERSKLERIGAGQLNFQFS